MTLEQWNDISGTFHPACTPDFLPLPQLRALQLQRLQATVRRACANVPLYKKRFDEKKIRPEAIQRLADIDLVPFTVKAELCYQPISFRWARNVEDLPSVEAARFISYFTQSSGSTAVVLARVSAKVQ